MLWWLEISEMLSESMASPSLSHAPSLKFRSPDALSLSLVLTPESALWEPRSWPNIPLAKTSLSSQPWFIIPWAPDGEMIGANDTTLSWSDMQPDNWRRASNSCCSIRLSCRSLTLSCAASASERSASSCACFISVHRSWSLSEVALATWFSESRIRWSNFRIKFRNSCSLSWRDAHRCLTCCSKSFLSDRSFFLSTLRLWMRSFAILNSFSSRSTLLLSLSLVAPSTMSTWSTPAGVTTSGDFSNSLWPTNGREKTFSICAILGFNEI